MTITWDQVHVGDTLRGADNQLWPVTGRTPGSRWVSSGAHDEFTMQRGDRRVTVTKRLIDPAPMAERADHSAMGQAWQALTEAGFRLSLIGESIVSDEFGDPAGKGRGTKGTTRDDGIRFDQYDRYLVPHPETGEVKGFTRVTTLAKTLADTYGLHQWDMRMVAKGVGMRPDLAALAASADIEEGKSTLNSVAKQAKEFAGATRGANFGSAFHAFAEQLDRGERPEGVPEAIGPDLKAYMAALKARSLRVLPEYMERVVFVPELEVVGTLDRIVSQPEGPTHSDPHAVLDLKSGKDLGYSWMEIAVQQACYSHASHMWDKASKGWVPMPIAVDQHRALVAHSPIGKGHTEIYGIDIQKGWTLAKASIMVRGWRKDTYSWLVAPDNPTAIALHLISQASSREALGVLFGRYKDIWTDDLTAAGNARLAVLEPVTQ